MIAKSGSFCLLFLFFVAINIFHPENRAISNPLHLQDSVTAHAVMARAKMYYGAKKYDSAIFWIENHLPGLRKTAGDSMVVNLQLELSKNHKRLKNYTKGIAYAKAALDLAGKSGDHTHLLKGQSLKTIGDTYLSKGVYDSALFYLQEGAITSMKGGATELAAFCYVGMGTSNYRLKNLSAMDQHLSKALDIADNYLQPDHRIYTILFQLFGVLNYQNGDFDRALEIAKKSITLIKKQTNIDTLTLAHSYNNVGAIYATKGDEGMAIQYYQLALGLHDLRNSNRFTLADVHNNIGLNYLRLGELNKSTVHLLKSLDLHEKKASIKLNIQHYNCLNNLAICYLKRELFDSSDYYLDRVFSLYETSEIWDALPDHTLGVLLTEKGDYANSVIQIKKAIDWHENSTSQQKPDLADVYTDLANTYYLMNEYDLALQWVNKVNEILDIDNSKADRPLIEMWSAVQSKNTLLRILKLEADIYQKKAMLASHINPQILDYHEKILLYIDHLRTDFVSEYSKLNLSRKVVPIYEDALEISLQLYDKTGHVKYFEKAFQIAERNKNLALDEAMKKLSIRQNGFIPDSLLQLEQRLQIDLSFYKRSIAEHIAKNTDHNDLKLNLWRNKVLQLSIDIDSLEQALAINFPQYYYSKYNKEQLTLSDVHLGLLTSPDKVVVEYFFGERNIYILSISSKLPAFDILPLTKTLHNHLDNFQLLISQPPTGKNADEDFNSFVETSHFLYEKLLSSVLPDDDSDSLKKIIVIPDHSLNYLPFESLISSMPLSKKVNYSGQNLSYLVKRFNINYGFSISTLLRGQQKRNRNRQKLFAGYAPTFTSDTSTADSDCGSGQLYNLHCSQQEINSIGKITYGTLFRALEATKASFVQNAPDFGILHLATHACNDETDPMMSRIHFADDFISTYELYALRLNADMAVLSACNTGSGKILKGEGVMSLARGFAFAGCPSLLTSLWSVDDCTTSQIMVEFYKNLAKGSFKDESLFNAKRSYLATQGRTNAHPYYWAGFIHVGDDKPLSLSDANYLKYLWLLLPIILFLFYFVYKRNKDMVRPI